MVTRRSTHRQDRDAGALLLVLVVAALVLAAAASPVQAQRAESDVLVARAVLAYDEQRYDEALALLDRALALNPRDARALYYTGLVHLALGRPERAVAPLEAATALRPSDVAARFQLGVAHFTLREYDKAEPLLESVFREQPDLENLGYYVGFLRYRRKAYADAAAALQTLKTSDPDIRQLALFYRGLALGVLGLSEQAVAELDAARRIETISPLTDAALRVREALAAQRRLAPDRRFRAQVSVGAFYDDNVAVNPDPSRDPVARSLRERTSASPGALATVQAEYSFLRHGPVEAIASYSLLQTINTRDDLDRFNIQSHQGGLAGFFRGAVGALPYQLGLHYTYDHLFLDQDSFLSIHTPTLSAAIVPPSFAAPLVGTVGNLTTALLRYQAKEFFNEPGDDDVRLRSEIRDASAYIAGFLHVFHVAENRHSIRIGYQYDHENAEGSAFSYHGHRIQTGGQVTLPWGDTALRYDYSVHWRDYTGRQTLFLNDAGVLGRRADVEQVHLLQAIKPLPHGFTLTAQYQRVDNGSNVPVYDYTKNVFSVILTWTY